MGGTLAAIGLAMGMAISLALVRFLRSAVIQVPAADTGARWRGFMLCGAAMLACLVPAQRAAQLEPMSALLHE